MASLSKRINADYPSPWSFEQIWSLRNKNFCLTILWDQVAFFTASPQSGWGSQLANLLAWQRTWHQNDRETNPDQQVANLFGLCYKSSWPGCLSLSLSLSFPPFFPWWTSAIMSNLDQSYFKKVNVLITFRSEKSRHNVWPSRDLTGQNLFLTRHCPLTSRYFKPWNPADCKTN